MDDNWTTLGSATPLVREFFEQYARSRSALDIDLIAAQYPDAFMVAGPTGARVAQKAAVLAAFPKGQDFLKAAGHKSTTVQSLAEARLDQRYVLARVQFLWRFEKPAAPPIEVEANSTFILHVDRGAPIIVFQHEREDFLETLRARGVLPARP